MTDSTHKNAVSLPIRTWKALAICAGKKDARYYLNGVGVDLSSGHVVATDGHRMLAHKVQFAALAPDPFRVTLIVPREAIDSLKIAGGQREVLLEIETDSSGNGTYTMIDGNARVSGDLIDGRYPDWRRVFPNEISGETAQFNPVYIGAFAKVAKELKLKESLTIAHNGDSAALIGFGLPYVVGLLMPWRAACEVLTETPEGFFSDPELSEAA